jgi:hypothetical protein
VTGQEQEAVEAYEAPAAEIVELTGDMRCIDWRSIPAGTRDDDRPVVIN